MSSIKLIGVMLLMSGPAAQAHDVSCPAGASGKPLSAVTVYDGPPIENASLVPDTTHSGKGRERSIWQVAGIYRSGRIPYLSCRYGTTKSIVLPVKQATVCIYAEAGKAKTLSCK